jgi:pilus assembly protein FimV
VAQQVRPAGVNANQAMLALQQANPDAFVGGNINRLRTGAILRIPNAEEFAAISAADAARQVREQADAWRGSPALQPVEAASSARATPPRAPTPAPTAPADSRLEVIPPRGETTARDAQSGMAAAAEGRELRAELARAREEVGALQEENRELKSRVGDLERIDADTRTLIRLKDSQLADAQRRLAELQAERAAAAQSAAALPVSDEPPPLDLSDAVAAPLESEADTPVDAALDADPVVADADAATLPSDDVSPVIDREPAPVAVAAPIEQPAPAAVAAPAAQPPAPARPWFMNPLVLGGAVLALIGLVLAVIRRRKPAEEPRRNGVSDAYAAATAGAAARAQQVQAASSAGDDQERQLLEAIAEQPDDLGSHLALVRHYYDLGDESGFEGAAEAMYAQLYDPDDMAWKQVVAMGSELLPDHPLFASSELMSDESDAVALASFDEPALETVGDEHAVVAEHRGIGAARATPSHEPPLEWGSAEASPTPSSSSHAYGAAPATAAAASAVSAGADAPDDGFDLDFGDDHAGAEAVFDHSAADPITDDGFADETAPGGEEAAATKLELARAYLDMGDVEGARGMLEEVVGEGNSGQRSEAKRLLDEIR